MVNDAVAYIRSLAQMRGRNAEWAVKAVNEAASLSSEDAAKQGVIDLIAADVDELLEKIHGRKVSVLNRERELDTADVELIGDSAQLAHRAARDPDQPERRLHPHDGRLLPGSSSSSIARAR